MVIQPGLTYLTRSQWGANTSIPRLGYAVARSKRTKAIIHHTVIVDSDATRNLWTNLAKVKAKMRQLQTIRPNLGMDVPYNFVMFLMEDGTIIVCEGRGLDRTGAHTYGHNTDGMATALQGNFMLATQQGLSRFVPLISRWWGWLRYDMKMVNLGSEHPGAIAYGHRDFRDPNDTSTWTSCPGDNLYAIIPQLEFKKVEEDNMKLFAGTPSGKVYIVGAEGKRYIGNPKELSAYHKGGLKSIEVPDAEIAAIRNMPTRVFIAAQTTSLKKDHLALSKKVDDIPVGGAEVDIDILAKAVVDEQHRRLKE